MATIKVTSKYADPQFWVDTADRVVATFFQTAVATLAVGTTGVLDVDFVQVLSVAGLAGIVALGTSIAFRGNSAPEQLARVQVVPDNPVPPAAP